jgi:hypothetical protein
MSFNHFSNHAFSSIEISDYTIFSGGRMVFQIFMHFTIHHHGTLAHSYYFTSSSVNGKQ